MKSVRIIILAAGQGKRMYSSLPKVLHPLAGRPLLEHVITTANKVVPSSPPMVIYGYQGELLREKLKHCAVKWIEQKEQLGTAHALLQAIPEISEQEWILVLYGDVPLISAQTLLRLIDTTPKNSIGMITAHLYHPSGYGRIKRDQQHHVIGIIEDKDTVDDEHMITEINPGIYLFPAQHLKQWLPLIANRNAQSEYYLTDIIAWAVRENIAISTLEPAMVEEILGVNDRMQLVHLERFYQRQMAEKLMQEGVTIMDPSRVDIRGDVSVGKDVTIDINVILEGKVVIAKNCIIGPHTILRDVELGQGVEIKAHSIIEGATVASHCVIGPFARIRSGSILASHVHVGNFVELKNAIVDEKAKINHLSYIGDSELGKRVNIGAGTITCNYDGIKKHKTIIGDDAFIGSGSQLVAPITIGKGAILGAGSTVVKDTPPHQLTLTHRLEQRSKAKKEK